MIRALYSAASGMLAQQLNVDNIANNLANANTTGFKNRKVQFQDFACASNDFVFSLFRFSDLSLSVDSPA
jgi:flagellar basal body rod protein FlgG